MRSMKSINNKGAAMSSYDEALVAYTESQYIWRMTLPGFGHVLIVWAKDGGYGQVKPAAEGQQLEGANMTFDPFLVSCRIKHNPDLGQIVANAVNADGYDKVTGRPNPTYTYH